MEDPKPDDLWPDNMKLNELNPGQREDMTTAEIIHIASNLADNERIVCSTFFSPTMRLTITLDNRPYHSVREMVIAVRLIEGRYESYFHVRDYRGHCRLSDGTWRNSSEVNIHEVAAGFGLDDEKIDNQHPTHGYWTGWFLRSYLGPSPTGH